jgi:hypothetical protein
MGDQPVLVGLDRRDDVAVAFPCPLQLFEQEVADAGAVERGAVEGLVGDVEQLASRARKRRRSVTLCGSWGRRVENGRAAGACQLTTIWSPSSSCTQRRPTYSARSTASKSSQAEEEAALGVLEGWRAVSQPQASMPPRDLAVRRRRPRA